jgi:hypothetical protein
MKFLAIMDVADDAPIEAIRAGLGEELRRSWALFRGGIVREAYATEKPTRIVFVLEADGMDDAASHLGRLPMIEAGMITFRLIELRPFANWSLLFADRGAGAPA